MAKNTYKQDQPTPVSRGNEPRPPRATSARPAPAETTAPRENRRASEAKAAPKVPRPSFKLPTFELGGMFAFVRDRRFQLFLGFFFLLGSLYLTIAFLSFLFTGHADQSVVAGLDRTPVKEAGQESGNWLGLVGAMVAQVFIYKGFGVAAFALIPIVFFLGYKIVFRRAGVSVSYVLALCVFIMGWLSVLLGYVVHSMQAPDADPALSHRLDFLSGGIGYEAALWLDSLIGWGTVLLLAFLLISFVVFFFNVTTLNLPRFGTEQEESNEAAPVPHNQFSQPSPRGNYATPATLEEEEKDFGMTVRSLRPTPAAAPPVTAQAFEDDDDSDDTDVPVVMSGSVASPAASVAPVAGAGLLAGAGAAVAGAALPLTVAPAAAAISAAGAAATVAAAGATAASKGPSFSIESAMDPEPVAVLPTRVPTPLSLADLADADAPLPASTSQQPSATNQQPTLQITKPNELDPAAGADMAVIADEDEDADAMPAVNYDPTLDLSRYQYPTLELLNDYGQAKAQVTKEELEANKDRIVETLGHYGINIASIKATIGPTVTLYEIVPDAGVRISKIKSLEDDIALSLAALGIRIIAPIPGKGTIGIEVPNTKKEMVSIRSVFSTEKFAHTEMDLPIAFGRTITNEVFVVDLAKMPHLLMAGATGQGKSVGLNVILASLLYKRHPAQLKFVLVDPKKVELSIFNKIERHFLAKLPDTEEAIITDTKKVVNTLNSLCMEMDRRYDLLKDAGCRNLKEYNRKFIERRLNPKKGHRYLPFIVLVIDELADLMMTAGKEVETPIARLAQLARAIGIHLIVATQRPSVNVITGIIKANFPCRISFKVTSKIDSRTILDAGGADQLVGQGDMLISQGSDIIRVQCAFIDTPEVDRLCDFVGEQQGYPDAYMLPEVVGESGGGNGDLEDMDPAQRDSMFEEAARVIVTHQQGSTSLLQRRLKLGYNRAGRLIDQLEHAGVVGPFEGSKAREVLIPDEYSLEQLLNTLPK
ncbi:DNA translocase FtsK 4TM domain-containing protein [Hymenobacter sp. BT186]|uniref:DNA translocase FtsK 4TM domain-containing protein n=1 Tax=Hymenobacter telluris TaxID=2816474 RepID=A0A939ES58_9BACT|nr:DNA translocase FtsK [Hymenobacter telluris]MBO0356478.1 DNA translocase FtsK 4TM domain-containing protein [Hymenobacter telluris]MBW3372502.1 DNA translocase FtsK [Hymenobacter norwichensis]